MTFTTEPVPAPHLPAATPAPAAATADSGMIEFDLGALSLDLPDAAEPSAAPAAAKAVAAPVSAGTADAGSTGGFEESGSSGDPAGHQAVRWPRNSTPSATPTVPAAWPRKSLAEASGDLKHQAQRFLARDRLSLPFQPGTALSRWPADEAGTRHQLQRSTPTRAGKASPRAAPSRTSWRARWPDSPPNRFPRSAPAAPTPASMA